MTGRDTPGYAMVIVAYLLVGLSGTLVALVTAPASLLLVLRFAVAFAVLAAVFLRPWRLRQLRAAGVSRRLLLMGAFDAATLLLFFIAVRETGVAVATFLYFTQPVWIALLAPRFLGSQTDAVVWAALGVALAGLVLILVPSFSGVTDVSWAGLAAGLGCGVLYAGFALLVKDLPAKIDSITLVLSLRGWKQRWHPIRLAAILAIMALMGAGGLLVSIKIGGGTNLHNMDVFLVILLLVAVELFFDRAVTDQGDPVHLPMPDWLIVLAVLVPVGFVFLFQGRNAATLDMAQAEADLATLQAYATEAVEAGGEVLFVSQRHLLTFGLIKGVPLVHEHEKLLLQEMVMSQNHAYLESFAEEMAEQKYALLVMDPLPRFWKHPDKVPLAVENNVVNKDLVPLVLCAYETKDTLLDGSLEILVPKAEPTCNLEKE
ncbi:MAG: DMT family transporter [Anaerolineales bacterium]